MEQDRESQNTCSVTGSSLGDSSSDPGRSDVGYGRPPEASRFKPGRSGNPKGRPKGAKSMVTLLLFHLHTMVTVRENGRERQMTKLAAGLTQMANKVAAGNPKTVRDWMKMQERPEAQTVEVQLPVDVTSLSPGALTQAAFKHMDRQFDRLLGKDEFVPKRRSDGEPAWYDPPVRINADK
jgi:hypothetical protein